MPTCLQLCCKLNTPAPLGVDVFWHNTVPDLFLVRHVRMKLTRLLQDLSIPTGAVELFLGNLMTVGFLTWNTIEGSVFQNEYPEAFVKLYTVPIWRLLLVLLMISASMWTHSLGIMIAFTIFFYVMDMEVTMEKWN